MERVCGVKAVAVEVEVRPLFAHKRVRVQAALVRQAVRAAHHVSITMDGSTVSLGGTVHSIAERVAIEGAAFSTAGVTAVENHLRVES